MPGTIELSEYVIDAIADAVVKKMQEVRYYPPCEDCHEKMDAIRKAYDMVQLSAPRFIVKSDGTIEQIKEAIVKWEPRLEREPTTESEVFNDLERN